MNNKMRSEQEIKNKIKELGELYTKVSKTKYENETKDDKRISLLTLIERRYGLRWCLGEDVAGI
jgi:hypothetical protein